MLPLISILFVGSSVAAATGWARVVKLNQKLTNTKRKVAGLDGERSYLLAQTTQLAEENAQLKARQSAASGSDVRASQEKRNNIVSRLSMDGTNRER